MLWGYRRMCTAFSRSFSQTVLFLTCIRYSYAFSVSRSTVPPLLTRYNTNQLTMPPGGQTSGIDPTTPLATTMVKHPLEVRNVKHADYRKVLITLYQTLQKFEDDVTDVANTRKLLEDFLKLRSKRNHSYRHRSKSRYRRFHRNEDRDRKSSFLQILNRLLLRCLCRTRTATKRKRGRLKLLLRYLEVHSFPWNLNNKAIPSPV